MSDQVLRLGTQDFPPGWEVSQIARSNVGASSDPHFSNVSLLIKDSIADLSNNAHTITNIGNVAATGTPISGLNGSIDFPVIAGTLEVDLDSSLTLGSEFTIEMYFKSNSRQTTDAALLCTLGEKYSWQLGFWFNRIYFIANTSRYSYKRPLLGYAPENSWVHLAVTRDSSNVMRMFINGKKVGQGLLNYDFSQYSHSEPKLRIGRNRANNRRFRGQIQNIRITKNVCRYVEDFDIPIDLQSQYNSLVLQDSNQDQSPNGYSLTFDGNASLTTNSKFGSHAFSVGGTSLTDGSNGIRTTRDFAIGRGNYTVEMWVYFEQDPTGKYVQLIRPVNSSYNLGPFMRIDHGGRIQIGNYSWGLSAPLLWETHRWYHIAASRSGSYYTRIYRDGKYAGNIYNWLESRGGYDFSNYTQSNTELGIGIYTEVPFIFDDLRITKEARYTGIEGFNVPVSTFPSQDIDPFPT